MNHKPPGTPWGKLLAEMPVDDECCVFCTNAECLQCGRRAWCIYVVVTPTPTRQAGMIPMCGKCLVAGGIGMATTHLGPTPGGRPIIKSAPEIEIVEAE